MLLSPPSLPLPVDTSHLMYVCMYPWYPSTSWLFDFLLSILPSCFFAFWPILACFTITIYTIYTTSFNQLHFPFQCTSAHPIKKNRTEEVRCIRISFFLALGDSKNNASPLQRCDLQCVRVRSRSRLHPFHPLRWSTTTTATLLFILSSSLYNVVDSEQHASGLSGKVRTMKHNRHSIISFSNSSLRSRS